MLEFRYSDNIKEVTKEIAQKRTALRNRLREAANYSALTVQRQAKRHLTGPFLSVDTGRLRSSVKTRVRVRGNTRHGGSFLSIVGTNVWYGRMWELEGMPAHTVTPVRAKALRWFDEAGQPVFAKRAHIPAQPPRPWLSMALEKRKKAIMDNLKKAVHEGLER